MTSLPMTAPGTTAESLAGIAGLAGDDEQFLLRAFRSFAEAAGSLEASYGELRSEVERLRHELARSNSDLASSLEENRSMREHLDRILEGLPCGVLVTSATGEISRVNPEALRLLGIKASGVGTAAATNLSSCSARVRALLASAEAEPGEQEFELDAAAEEAQEKEGQGRWLAARHASIANGQTGASVFILRDTSEGRRLAVREEKLGRERALAEMSAVLAHEIRNPLGSLELFAGLLGSATLDRECRKWVGHLQAGMRTLAATVNNVLQFHALPAPALLPVDLGGWLDWGRDFLAPLAHQNRIQLRVRHELGGVTVSADRHRLEQVLLNLALNAVRAMPGGGLILVTGRCIDDCRAAAISVTDSGPGISAEHLPRIFEPGFSTRAGSPGLGLAVARKIVEQHGGSLTAASRAGSGATFRLQLPLVCSASVSGGLSGASCLSGGSCA